MTDAEVRALVSSVSHQIRNSLILEKRYKSSNLQVHVGVDVLQRELLLEV